MSNYDQTDTDRQLRDQLEEARSAGSWIPWACSTLAIGWWGGAAAYVIGKIGINGVMDLPPAELGGGVALALAPGLALVLAGVMGRESVRSSHANAIVLQASTALLSPGRHHAREIESMADMIRTASHDIAEQLSDAEARVQVLRQDLDTGANAAFKAAEVVRADGDAMRGKLADEREALHRLSEDMRKQMTSLSESLPLHVENLTRASAQAQSDVRAAGRELDERLNAVEETGKALASRVAQLDQMTSETRKRAQNLVTALVSINEQLLGSSRTVDNAVKAGDLAVEASRSTAEAIRLAMDSALDGARETVEGLNLQAAQAKAETQAAIERLDLAGQRAQASVKAATEAANHHAAETEGRMDQMSERMYQAALKSTHAAESGLERARQRIERASVLLNGMDDSGASASQQTATASQPHDPDAARQAPVMPSTARIVRADRPSMPQAPVDRTATPGTSSPGIRGLDEDILGPETPPAPTAGSSPGSASSGRLNIQNLVPFDPLEDTGDTDVDGLPTRASAPVQPPEDTPNAIDALPRLRPNMPTKPVAASRPMPGDETGPAVDIGRPANSDMTWRDLLSSIDEPDGRNETALAFVEQLDRAGIRLKRAIRSSDLRRIAMATGRGERHRRKATRQAAPGELQQIERLLRQDHDLRVAAESYLALEEPDAVKFLTGAERTRDDAGPRLAAFLLLDAALG